MIQGQQLRKSYFEVKNFESKIFCLEKNKELVDTLQSGTNSSIDCHVSKDGKRLWNLSENGEVMCFDLRMMKAVNAFEDMFGATSLGLLIRLAFLNAFAMIRMVFDMYFSGEQQRNAILHWFIIWFDQYL